MIDVQYRNKLHHSGMDLTSLEVYLSAALKISSKYICAPCRENPVEFKHSIKRTELCTENILERPYSISLYKVK